MIGICCTNVAETMAGDRGGGYDPKAMVRGVKVEFEWKSK